MRRYEVGARLGISSRTVESHLRRRFERLGSRPGPSWRPAPCARDGSRRSAEPHRSVPGDNGRVILVTGILIAVFVVPDAWTLPVIGLAVVAEVTETLFTLWWSRRAPPKVGPETLIGATGRVVDVLQPIGRVRVRGEVWQARSDEELGVDVRVRVTSRDRLTLTVERLDD